MATSAWTSAWTILVVFLLIDAARYAIGVVYDLGSPQDLSGVTVETALPGATVEIRTADTADGALDDFAVAANGTLEQRTELPFDDTVTAQYVLVWLTGLVDSPDGFSAELAEVEITTAG